MLATRVESLGLGCLLELQVHAQGAAAVVLTNPPELLCRWLPRPQVAPGVCVWESSEVAAEVTMLLVIGSEGCVLLVW